MYIIIMTGNCMVARLQAIYNYKKNYVVKQLTADLQYKPVPQ